MPYDSQGKFTRLHNWEQDRIDDIDIVTDHHDEEDDNFASGLNECFLRNGMVPMSGNLDMGSFKLVKVGDGTSSKDAVNKSQLDSINTSIMGSLNSLFLIGDIKCSALQKDHKNWLICDGRELSRTTYPDLFKAIGTTFGSGDGSYTFNLPDCRGVVVRGFDSGRGLDKDRKFGSYQQDGLPEISGNIYNVQSGVKENKITADGAFECTKLVDNGNTLSGGAGGFTIKLKASKSSSVYGKATEARVKNIALNYFIKAKEE